MTKTAPIPRLVRRAILLLALAVVTILALRAWDARRGMPLERWHTFVPRELSEDELDRADWPAYLQAEERVLASVRDQVTARTESPEPDRLNRYASESPVDPFHFAHDWNRSFVLEPDAAPAGAVVLLHGLTDSPYSQRHLARLYREHGFVAIAIRLPGHGTVPGGLTGIDWEDWLAATRLAVREARRRVGPSLPLHVVGYSNGGALAVKYALDALDDAALPRPDRVVLLSPMIGVTRFARFAGLAAVPALLPAFASAAWLSITPEFNPFKYNSFPVNGATQSHRLTEELQKQIVRDAAAGRLAGMPPVLTFQSVLDFTVSTPALFEALYDRLPSNGSELVLFDVNRSSKFAPLLSTAADTKLSRVLPAAPRRYRTAIVTSAGPASAEVVEIATAAGAVDEQRRPLGMTYPAEVYSLSHIAIPFPISDGLYGLAPDPDDDFGIRLGTLAAHGEVGGLVLNMNAMLRMSSNPFFPYVLERIAAGIGDPPHD
ncbi:alpha/beta hydrolase [Candidatus Binatia bacterium]|nr:alpha/beta hydrolase [Candidatus Binatia bacterium]